LRDVPRAGQVCRPTLSNNVDIAEGTGRIGNDERGFFVTARGLRANAQRSWMPFERSALLILESSAVALASAESVTKMIQWTPTPTQTPTRDQHSLWESRCAAGPS
jgi:hypothetical protein